MEKLLVNPSDAVKALIVSSRRFVSLQSSGKIKPLVVDGKLYYDLHELKRILRGPAYPAELKDGEYLTVLEALRLLAICRKTFYDRVKSGEIPLQKVGRRSYVKKSDLFTDDDLF